MPEVGKRRRRAVGPRGATVVDGPEPRPEPAPGSSEKGDDCDDERFLSERPPHHELRD